MPNAVEQNGAAVLPAQSALDAHVVATEVHAPA
jgi:hypothetical protein